MARHLQSLFEVDAVLTAVVPLHVGNSDTEMAQDAPLACNGAGNPYLPGTSLAGPLRAWWREAFGNVAGWGDESDEYGYASLISVEDAPAILDGGVPELRDGVGIDRFTGAAAKNIKYDRQILPAGTTFGFKLRLEVPAKADKDEPVPFLQPDQWLKRLSGMMRALEAGHIRFGAGKTRGFGRVEASDIVIIRHELNTADGILARLTGDSPKLDWTKVAPEQLPNRVVLLVNWRATSPVMNNSGLNGLAIDAFPLTTGSRAERLAVLTGASIKGVLRSQAERIWRTLDGRSGADQTPNHLKQIELELVEPLFGGPGKAESQMRRRKTKRTRKKNQPAGQALARWVWTIACSGQA